ncbi:MAG: cysteine desulfurase [Bacteroidetes bacterium]|nr:cysteine desulfurase [Bacteroidota bacterium]
MLDVESIRKDFPALNQDVYGKPLVYLDNAATAQKPQVVINAITEFYSTINSNVHRGIHYLSQQATEAYESARVTSQKFINASESSEIIFVKGTTEAINLVASTFGIENIGKGDEILVSNMEHHSNIVPWQLLCEKTGAKLKVIPINDSGELEMDELKSLLTDKTKLVSIIHVSNSLGTINPMKEIVTLAHEKNIPVLVDGAQAVQHITVDVQDMDCDFYTFSGHKVYGPTGVGVLYAKKMHLEKMPPYQGGGEMISTVSFEKTEYNTIPHKFEAGTPNIAGVIGLAKALNYVNKLGLSAISAYESQLLTYASAEVEKIPELRIIGRADRKASVLSFVLENIHPHDVGTVLDREGIAVRSGHHCTQPVMDRYQIPATSRASFAFYNTEEEIDRLVKSIKRVVKLFG